MDSARVYKVLMVRFSSKDGLQKVLLPFSLGRLSNSLSRRASSQHPRWDGTRVLFEIADGERRIRCAVSQAALENLSAQRHVGGVAFIRSFVIVQEQIEAVARDKLRAMPDIVFGTLNIWASDVDDLPPSGASAQSHKSGQRLTA